MICILYNSLLIAVAVAEIVVVNTMIEILPIVTTPRQLVKAFAACILPAAVVVLEHG